MRLQIFWSLYLNICAVGCVWLLSGVFWWKPQGDSCMKSSGCYVRPGSHVFHVHWTCTFGLSTELCRVSHESIYWESSTCNYWESHGDIMCFSNITYSSYLQWLQKGPRASRCDRRLAEISDEIYFTAQRRESSQQSWNPFWQDWQSEQGFLPLQQGSTKTIGCGLIKRSEWQQKVNTLQCDLKCRPGGPFG